MGPGFKVFIKSYGCQMNVYDSERMADFFVNKDCTLVDSYEDANLVILNTCEIREKAEEKLFSDLGRIKPYREKAHATGNEFVVVVTGCVAQLLKTGVIKRSKCVDIVLGPQMVQNVYECVEKLMEFSQEQREPVSLTDFKSFEKFSKFSPIAKRGVSSFVTIQEGCDNFCTYCIVPHTRGREFSRPVADVLSEINSLVDLGVKEITLLGQNVNSYRGVNVDGTLCSLPGLIEKIYESCDLRLLRFATSNPHDMTDDLVNCFASVPILMPFLHLPIQSGSDRILELMNRKYTVEAYKNVIKKLRTARPDIAFSSDFIVGFPGETNDDFQKTLDIVNEVGYAQAYSFKYSPRPNTKAAIMSDQVPNEVKEERLEILQKLIDSKQNEFNQSTVGKEVDVLLVKDGKHEGQLVGRTPYYQAIAVEANEDFGAKMSIGDVVRVKVTRLASHSLIGEVVNG